MATATLTSQAICEWTRIFPLRVAESHTSSLIFVKKLTSVAISLVAYLRQLFTEDNFEIENFEGIKLRILKNKCNNDLAQFLSTGLTQAEEAFDKQYLHKLMLCFYDGDGMTADNLIESWILEYFFKNDTISMNVHSKFRNNKQETFTIDDIKSQTLRLVRTILVVLETRHEKLPDSLEVCLKLYYNENAPKSYQAPGFRPAQDFEDHMDSIMGKSLSIGKIHTPFHGLHAYSYAREEFDSSSSRVNVPSTPTKPVTTQMDLEFDSLSQSPMHGRLLRCVCNLDPDNEYIQTALIICQFCKTRQHAACYGFSNKDVARVGRHCCTYCSDDDPTRIPTDKRLADSFDRMKREALCLFRHIIMWLKEASSVAMEDLVVKFQVSRGIALKLLKKFHSYRIISEEPEDNFTASYNINQKELSHVMSNYFHNEDGDIVERLLAESLSQPSQPDPITGTLGPVQSDKLQSTSKMGRITPAMLPKTSDDSTLNRYRDAIRSIDNDMENFKLSDKNRTFKKRRNSTRTVAGIKTKKARRASDK